MIKVFLATSNHYGNLIFITNKQHKRRKFVWLSVTITDDTNFVLVTDNHYRRRKSFLATFDCLSFRLI